MLPHLAVQILILNANGFWNPTGRGGGWAVDRVTKVPVCISHAVSCETAGQFD
jgi:hypothetical protein